MEFFVGGGDLKKKSCSECAETCSRFGIFETQQNFLFRGGGGVVSKKVAQNVLILEFLQSDFFFFFLVEKSTDRQTNKRRTDQIRRSAL